MKSEILDFNIWFETRDVVSNKTIIKANDPVRNAVSNVETYWDSPGKAISQISSILNQFGYQINGTISFDDNLPDFRMNYELSVSPDPNNRMAVGEDVKNSMLVFSWHRMESGRYEITAYLS